MTVLHFRDLLRKRLPQLKARYRIASLELFGSRVRGSNRSDSDLDVLVAFDETPSLFRFIELEQELGDFLGVRVDLVMRESLRPEVAQQVSQELVSV